MAPPQGLLFYIDSSRENSSNILSETTGPIKARFHMEPQWVGGMKVCSPHLSHMTKNAGMPIYGTNLLKSSPEPKASCVELEGLGFDILYLVLSSGPLPRLFTL